MEFKAYLEEQKARHPSMGAGDVVKQCYQAARGAEHLVKDPAGARAWFAREFREAPGDGPLTEAISDRVCRVNLGPWREKGLPGEWLFRMFLLTAQTPLGGEDKLEEYLAEAGELVREGKIGFSAEEWERYLASYRKAGGGAVHHSEGYRTAEKPAYRVVDRRLARVIPVLEELASRAERGGVVAVDGRAASGKTTVGEQLAFILGAGVVHMDDFFLPPALRTPERLGEPGGNVDYDRFAQEVLPGLEGGEEFSYRIFDCSQMDFSGERRVEKTPFRIVEGSYSCHPRFGDYADVRVFSDVDPEEQLERIARRNGEAMLEMFKNRWIPMEEAYFAHDHIRARAHVVLGQEDEG